MIKKATAVLLVESIEKSLPFFEAAGFDRGVEVPHGPGLGFIILEKGNSEVMLQTYASAADDVKSMDMKAMKQSRTYLFVEVDDLATVEKALKGQTIVLPRRVTPYGATETGYQEPGGHFVTFAQFGKS